MKRFLRALLVVVISILLAALTLGLVALFECRISG